MSNVLITGGTGFIGSRLVQVCKESGDAVRILGQANTLAETEVLSNLRKDGLEVIEGSVVDRDTVVRALRGVEIVYHLAAAQHEAEKSDKHFYDVNVEGTRNMVEGSIQNEVKRFVHGSTIGVYQSDKGTVREDSATVPDNIYGVTKLQAEGVLAEYRDKLPIVCVRISETYGPGDRRLLKLFKGVQKGSYFHIGKSGNLHHPVFIDDLVNALRKAAVRDEAIGHTMVVPGFEVVTTREMANTIAKVLGVNSPRLTIPLGPLWTIATIMEWFFRPLGIKPPLHRRRMHFFIKSFDFTENKTQQLLGYSPEVSFEKGIILTANWYKGKRLIDS